jgi:hypothetical protein
MFSFQSLWKLIDMFWLLSFQDWVNSGLTEVAVYVVVGALIDWLTKDLLG